MTEIEAGKIRHLLSYSFEGGGYVSVTVCRIDTAAALDKLDELIAMKRAELAALIGPRLTPPGEG